MLIELGPKNKSQVFELPNEVFKSWFLVCGKEPRLHFTYDKKDSEQVKHILSYIEKEYDIRFTYSFEHIFIKLIDLKGENNKDEFLQIHN